MALNRQQFLEIISSSLEFKLQSFHSFIFSLLNQIYRDKQKGGRGFDHTTINLNFQVDPDKSPGRLGTQETHCLFLVISFTGMCPEIFKFKLTMLFPNLVKKEVPTSLLLGSTNNTQAGNTSFYAL